MSEPPMTPRPARKRAVALRYQVEEDDVPRVVAKGEGKVAEKILEIARERGIAIHEDPDLMELLCKLEVQQQIPEKLFVAVAEVMAFVYRVNHGAESVSKLAESLSRDSFATSTGRTPRSGPPAR